MCSMAKFHEYTTIVEHICVRKDCKLEKIAKELHFLGEEVKGEEVSVRDNNGEEYLSNEGL